MKIIDISRDLLTTPVYPGDPEQIVEHVRSMQRGDSHNLTVVSSCVHTGTHVDAPTHFIKDGKNINEIPLEVFFGNCYVFQPESSLISKAEIEAICDKNDVRRLLLKGDAYLTNEACFEAINRKIQLIGTEHASVDPLNSDFSNHKILLDAEVVLLENLDLSCVECGCYMLSAFPIKMKDVEGAFVRAVLIEKE